MYARLLRNGDLPRMRTPDDVKPNSVPFEGAAALFKYGKTPHIAVVLKIVEDGFYIGESNYHTCHPSSRFIPWNDPHLRGFYA